MEKAMGRLHIFHTGIFMELTFLSTATALCSLFITMNVMQKKKKKICFFFFCHCFCFHNHSRVYFSPGQLLDSD